MPGLQAFCVCTAISLGAIYLLQITWFAAWMYLDEERIQSQRSGLVPCMHISSYKEASCSSYGIGKNILQQYTKLLPSFSFKVLVILTSLMFTSIGISGCILMKQKFDYLLLLPVESYLRQWYDMKKDLYPDKGWVAEIYTDSFDYSDLEKFENLIISLEELKKAGTYIQGDSIGNTLQ